MSNSKDTVKTATNSVVRLIMAKLAIGDAGKLDWAYDKITSKLAKDIKKHQFDLDKRRMEHNENVADLKERISEAELDLIDVVASVTVDEANNLRQDGVASFVARFENRLDNAYRTVDVLKDELERENDTFKTYNKSIKITMTQLNDTIDLIKKGVK